MQDKEQLKECCENCRQVFKSGLVHCLGITTCPCHTLKCLCEELDHNGIYTLVGEGHNQDCPMFKKQEKKLKSGLICSDDYGCEKVEQEKCDHEPTGEWEIRDRKSYATCKKCGEYETSLIRFGTPPQEPPVNSSEINTSLTEDWVAELDDLFAPDGDTINQILEYRGIYDCGKCFLEDEQERYIKPIKSWIASKKKHWLEQQRAEMVEEIGFKKVPTRSATLVNPYLDGYNQAMEDVIISLNKYRE